MNVSEPTTPADPIARLEARVRWLTALCSFLTLGLLALVAWQFVPRPKVIEANAFVLRDHQWRRRGELGLREDDSPMLRLNDPLGRERVMLSARESGTTIIRLTDDHDVFRARIELDPKGNPMLQLSAADGSARVTLTPLGESGGGLNLIGDDRKTRWSAP